MVLRSSDWRQSLKHVAFRIYLRNSTMASAFTAFTSRVTHFDEYCIPKLENQIRNAVVYIQRTYFSVDANWYRVPGTPIRIGKHTFIIW
jgi:hypothetical protein